MSNINITVYNSKAAQDAAERAEIAALKAENIKIYNLKNEIPAPQGMLLPDQDPQGNPLIEGLYMEVNKGDYTNLDSSNLPVIKDKGKLYFNGAIWEVALEWNLPVSVADGEFTPGETKGLSGDVAYNSVFGDLKPELSSVLVNKGKRFPLKNYYTETVTNIIRLKKAFLDVKVFCTDKYLYNYSISLLAKSHENSGNRIDIRKKDKSTNATVSTYSYATKVSGSNNTSLKEEVKRELDKLESGNIETLSIISDDNTFKVELTFDTSEFASGQEAITLSDSTWQNFIFQESVYRTGDIAKIGKMDVDITNLKGKMPVKYVDSGITLTIPEIVIRVDGTFSPSSGGNRSIFQNLDLNNLPYFTGTMAGGSATGIAFYGSANEYLGGQFPSTGVQFTIYRQRINPPQGAIKYVACSYSNNFKLELLEPDTIASSQDVQESNNRITNIESKVLPDTIMQSNVRNEMNRTRVERNIAVRDSLLQPERHWFGVKFIEEDPNPDNLIRISSLVGEGIMPLHVAESPIGLPIMKKMRSAIVKKDGTVNYWLDKNNSLLKSDGITPAVLSGADGDMMTWLPGYWLKIEREQNEFNGQSAEYVHLKLAEWYIDDSWIYIPSGFTSPVKATVDWASGELRSVVTTNFETKNVWGFFKDLSESEQQLINVDALNITGYASSAANYRGAANNLNFDNSLIDTTVGMPVYPSNYIILDSGLNSTQRENVGKFIKNGLGREFAASKSRARKFMRESARKRSNRHNIALYDHIKTLQYFMMVEFATRNLQQPFTSERTLEGYTKGGLGPGATTLRAHDFDNYKLNINGFHDEAGYALIPNGVTMGLGNNSGEVNYYLPYFPSGTGSGENYTINSWSPYILKCNSYRGIEHIFGHSYTIFDQLNVQVDVFWQKVNESGQSLSATGKGNAISDFHMHYSPTAAACSEENNKYYEYEGFNRIKDYCIFYIKKLKWDLKRGHTFPIETTGEKTPSHYFDLFEGTNPPDQYQTVSETNDYPTVAGRVCNGQFCGPLFYVYQHVDPNTRPSDSTRLDYR